MTFRVIENNKTVGRYESKSAKSFRNHVGTINWKKSIVVSLRVNYGDGFVNEGEYGTKKDFMIALKAFLEI